MNLQQWAWYEWMRDRENSLASLTAQAVNDGSLEVAAYYARAWDLQRSRLDLFVRTKPAPTIEVVG